MTQTLNEVFQWSEEGRACLITNSLSFAAHPSHLRTRSFSLLLYVAEIPHDVPEILPQTVEEIKLRFVCGVEPRAIGITKLRKDKDARQFGNETLCLFTRAEPKSTPVSKSRCEVMSTQSDPAWPCVQWLQLQVRANKSQRQRTPGDAPAAL